MLTGFGTTAVVVMLVSYWLEPRSRWFVLSFAVGSAATAAYSGLLQAYPITAVEGVWALVALHRWLKRMRADLGDAAAT